MINEISEQLIVSRAVSNVGKIGSFAYRGTLCEMVVVVQWLYWVEQALAQSRSMTQITGMVESQSWNNKLDTIDTYIIKFIIAKQTTPHGDLAAHLRAPSLILARVWND